VGGAGCVVVAARPAGHHVIEVPVGAGVDWEPAPAAWQRQLLCPPLAEASPLGGVASVAGAAHVRRVG
jgi:hypothetical protein